MSQARSGRLNVRVAERDDQLFRRAASVADESLSEFMIASGRERAARVLADRTRFELTEERWRAFVEALDRPAEADPALRALFERPRPE